MLKLDSYDQKKKTLEIKEQCMKVNLSKPPPKIEKVADFEVYLVKEGMRIRRICGGKIPNVPKEYVCTYEAGRGTKHKGVGLCKSHDKQLHPSTEKYWEKMNVALKVPPNLGELFKRAEGISKYELLSPLNQARRIAALVWDILGNPEDTKKDKPSELSHWQRVELRNLETLWLKIIEADKRLEGQTVMKGAVITFFLQNIWDIIYQMLGPVKGRIMTNRILKITYAHHDEGKIGGDIRELEEGAMKAELKIEKHKEVIVKEDDEEEE